MHPPDVEAIVISDAELGSLARAGDMQALAGLLERCRPSLYATAIGLLGNRADALDAVQDTFVVALVRLAELRHPGAARAWLHTVLRNVCLMRIRQRRDSSGTSSTASCTSSPYRGHMRSFSPPRSTSATRPDRCWADTGPARSGHHDELRPEREPVHVMEGPATEPEQRRDDRECGHR
jgi:RNA polymerase sigma factor (sigma-70 family)